MPQLIFQGITVDQVKTISSALIEELAELCQCELDNFSLEVPQSIFIFNKKEISSFPFIEVKWFERGQEVRDEFASIISKHVHSLGIPEVEVAFSVFAETSYYCNGKHFG